MEQEKVVIIGAGVAGLTAAIYTSRAMLNPLVITGQLPGGLLTQTSEVENFPGFEEGVNGYELVAKIQSQAERFGTRIEYDYVSSVKFIDNQKQYIKLSSGKEIEAESVIIATGATPRYLGLESEDKFKNLGVSSCATCDGAFYRNMEVCVIGGGDSAMEEANFLTKFATKVTLIHRRDEFRASQIMLDRVKNNSKIEIITNSVVEEIFGAKDVDGIRIKNIKDNSIREISCKGVFIALGHKPATDVFANIIDLDNAGFIVLKDRNSKTNISGVFAAGDCADSHYRQAICAAGMGAIAGMDVVKYLENQ